MAPTVLQVKLKLSGFRSTISFWYFTFICLKFRVYIRMKLYMYYRIIWTKNKIKVTQSRITCTEVGENSTTSFLSPLSRASHRWQSNVYRAPVVGTATLTVLMYQPSSVNTPLWPILEVEVGGSFVIWRYEIIVNWRFLQFCWHNIQGVPKKGWQK